MTDFPATRRGRLQPVVIDEPSTPLLRMIGNNPRLVDLFRTLTRTLVRESQLPPRDRWLVTLRMAWRCKCTYEFGRHATESSSKFDLQIATSTDLSTLSDADHLLMTFVDQIYTTQNIDDTTWTEISKSRSPAEIVEIISVIGLYFMAGSMANVCGVEAQ